MAEDSASDSVAGTGSLASSADAEDMVLAVTNALAANDTERAMRSARALSSMLPPDPRGLVLVGQYFERAGNSGLILAHLAPYAHKFPNDGPLREIMARAHNSLRQRHRPAGLEVVAAAGNPAGPIDKEAAVHAVAQALQANDVDAAVKAARSLANMDPPDGRGLLLLAQCFLQTGRHTSLLVPHVAPYIHKFPADPSLHWILSLGYHSLGQRSKAAEHTELVVRLKPNWGRAQFSLGHYYYEAGNPARAIPHLRKAAELLNDFDSHHFLSIALALGGEFQEALTYNTRALEIDPAHDSARSHGEELQDLVRARPPETALSRAAPQAQT